MMKSRKILPAILSAFGIVLLNLGGLRSLDVKNRFQVALKKTGPFPIQKSAIFCKIKKMCGGKLSYATQAIPGVEA